MSILEWFFWFGLVILAGGLWALFRADRRGTGRRVVVFQRAELPEEELARIFGDWDLGDERLAAVLQVVQEWLDTAQGQVVAKCGTDRELNAAAGAQMWMEQVLGDLVERVQRGKRKAS